MPVPKFAEFMALNQLLWVTVEYTNDPKWVLSPRLSVTGNHQRYACLNYSEYVHNSWNQIVMKACTS